MMSELKQYKPFAIAAGAVFAGSMATSAMAGDDNPFGADELAQGYGGQDFQVAEGACGEGTCGEGGDKDNEEGSCGEDGDKDSEEGSCGEGSCGEGTCG
jgi:uncharacterized low-complexity protein